MRTRLLVALVGIATLALAAFAIPLLFVDSARIHNAVDEELRRDVTRVSFFVPPGFGSGSVAFRLPTDDPDLTASVYNRTGTKVAGDGPPNGDRLVALALDGETSCGSVQRDRICTQPLIEESTVVGAVRASEPLATARKLVRRRLLAFFLGGMGVLAIAILAALGGARRLSRPIAELRNAAVRLGGGDYTVRLPKSGIAEMDETSDALAHAAARIGREVERERAFSADVSHQLRTPITSLRAALETEQLVPREDSRVILAEALIDVARLEATVRHLLALTRDAPLDRQILPTVAILQTLAASWRPVLASAGRSCQLTVASPVRDVVVRASRSAVEQILDVLISNAQMHGAGIVTVSALVTPSGALAIRVGDEGKGINGESSVIFERRTSPAGGTGIGLALAATLAKAEGGELILERSAPRPVFRLTLPPLPIGHDGSRVDRHGDVRP